MNILNIVAHTFLYKFSLCDLYTFLFKMQILACIVSSSFRIISPLYSSYELTYTVNMRIM